MKPDRNPWTIYLVLLLLFLPLYILRDYTPNNELRYVSIVEEALQRGSIFVFYNHDIPYADKPPFYFWVMMIGKLIAGNHLLIFMGCFNLLVAAFIIWEMNKWCFPNASFSVLLPPTLVLLTTGLFTGSFLVVRMDLLMTLFIILSTSTFFRLYTGKGSKDDEWLFPLFLFLGVFTKGPLGFLLPVAAILLFLLIKKDIPAIKRYLGIRTLAIFGSLCLIWFIAVWVEGDIAYLKNLLFHQTIDRAIDSFHHQEPFYFYLWRFWIFAAPWSLFCAFLFIEAFRKKMIAGNPLLLFFAVMIGSTFIILSLISSKLDIYLLPVYPFCIYFAFMVLREKPYSRLAYYSMILPIGVLFCILPILLIGMKRSPVMLEYPVIAIGGAILAIFAGVIAIWFLIKRQITQSIIVCAGSLLIFILLSSIQLPPFNEYLGLKAIAEEGRIMARKHQTTRFAFTGFQRGENMEVYLDVPVSPVEEEQVIGTNPILPPYILFVREKEFQQNIRLQQFLSERENRLRGKYRVFVIEK